MSYKVFFYEVFDEEETALRHFLPADWDCTFSSSSIQESNHAAPPAAVISIRTQSQIPDSWNTGLDAILSRSAGFDHLTAYKQRTGFDVKTGHLYRYSGRAVAEHAAMLWMSLLRKLPSQNRAIKNFSRDGLTGRECKGRTLAVFGVGDIGHSICQIGNGLEMKILGVDIVERHPDVQYVSRDAALAVADVIVCAMNLTDTNVDYFSREILQACRNDAVFINVARGEFARNSSLLRLLEDGQLAGVGLDVFYDEPSLGPALRENKECDHPEFIALQELLIREDAILTPHNAFNTIEAVGRKSQQTAEQLIHFFETGNFIPHPSSEQA